MQTSAIDWKTGFFITLILFVLVAARACFMASDMVHLQTGYNNVVAALQQHTSANAQSQQQCIQQAQTTFYASSILATAAPDLQAATQSCETEYPTQ